MAIRRWHWGKLVVLWTWGAMVAGPLFTFFIRRRTTEMGTEPVSIGQAAAFLVALAVLLSLSAVTWRWLGGKE